MEQNILPKGFVVNSDQIGPSLEQEASDPIDSADIARIWKVYTTTKRRLLDPTAERLENYWWRIWGSRRRQLDGATVARLFLHISDGQSFVPLRGPANRDEGSPPKTKNVRLAPVASSTTALYRRSPGGSKSESTNSSSSLSRPPTVMPHPILKKTRGPSSTGPRPTARFVSPHESEQETEPYSSAGSNSNVVVQPPSPDVGDTKADKKSTTSTRKRTGFVAASATKKKRPVMPRRQSSQTSGLSSESSKASGSASSTQSPVQRTIPPEMATVHAARGKQAGPSRFQEHFSPVYQSPVEDAAPAEQVSPKRTDANGVSPRKAQNARSSETISETAVSDYSGKRGAGSTTQESRVHSQPDRSKRSVKGSGEKSNESEQKLPGPVVKSSENARVRTTSRSHVEGEHQGSLGGLRLGTHEASKSSASLAPTLTAVNGQLAMGDGAHDDKTEGSSRRSLMSPKAKGKGRAAEKPSHEDVFSKKPIKPTASTPVSENASTLSRSKSQLTLLLEKDQKDRAKNAEHRPLNGKRH